MKRFKEMGITAERKTFVGDKIKLERILKREIVVHGFKIEPSKYLEKGNGKCLHMQIELKDEKYVVFTSSMYLQDMISRVPQDEFPFETTIVKVNDHFEFS
jgi:hypothetical protein